jgi:hypothetical protein
MLCLKVSIGWMPKRKSAFLHPLLQHSWNWIFVDRIFSGSWIRRGGIPTASAMLPLSQFVMNSLPIRSHRFLSSWVIKSRKRKEWLFRHADSAMSFFFFTRSAFWKKMPFRPDKRRAATAGGSLAGVEKLDNQVSYFICKYPPAGIIGRTLRHGKTLINCKP